jgi:hypothetical protein
MEMHVHHESAIRVQQRNVILQVNLSLFYLTLFTFENFEEVGRYREIIYH